MVPLPSPESLAHRAELARLFAPLKRVRPRVPFWKLPAHRIPTLWSLYRGLMRDAPTEDIRWRMWMFFRRHMHLTSPTSTREKLQSAHKWLDMFRSARDGDVHLRSVLQRYSRLIAAKREKEQMKAILRAEWAWQAKLRRRPIMTGAHLKPTLLNRPLPRLKPQPDHISMIIRKRRFARERRGSLYSVLTQWKNDLGAEAKFEAALDRVAARDGTSVAPVFRDKSWSKEIDERLAGIRNTFALETRRAKAPYSAEMLDALAAARREKWRNKTHERERERRGEVLPRTAARRRQGPPAHVLARMSPARLAMDRAVRSVSEVGYVAQVKRRMGVRLRDDETWRLEDGKEGEQERLDAMEREVRATNEARRRRASVEGD